MGKQLLICGGILALLAVPAMAQKGGPTAACNGLATNDIGGLFPAQPNGGWVVANGDCSGDCDDYFEMDCEGGETVTASFCQGGGSASWDTALRALQGGSNITCNDDVCSLLSEITFAAPAGIFEIRIDTYSDEGEASTYSLAVSAPRTCAIVGAIPVTLESFEIGASRSRSSRGGSVLPCRP